MNLTLTAEQNADRERLGACVVPGEQQVVVAVGQTGAVMPGGGWYGGRSDVEFRPPRQFSDAAAPCPTCDGTGTDGYVLLVGPCPDCRGGKPIIEIRVPCPWCGGTGKRELLTTNFIDCPDCGGGGFVTAARATVTLLPVIYVDQLLDDNPPIPCVCLTATQGGVLVDQRKSTVLSFDPLPVAGRDWVAVFEDVL
jgi:hypothetical protein